MPADSHAELLAALRSGRIGMITLDIPVMDDGGESAVQSLRCEVSSLDLKRFWRRVKPLAAIAELPKK